MLAPIPREEPVTIATLPCSGKVYGEVSEAMVRVGEEGFIRKGVVDFV